MMSDYFRNYGIRDKESVFRDTHIAGSGMFQVACCKSPFQCCIVTMFMEIGVLNAIRSAESQHYLFEDKLFCIELFMFLYTAWICDVSLQIGFVPHAKISADKAMGAGTETDVWYMTPVGAVMYGFVARMGKIRYFIMMVSRLSQCFAKDAVLPLAKLIRRLRPCPLFRSAGKCARKNPG